MRRIDGDENHCRAAAAAEAAAAADVITPRTAETAEIVKRVEGDINEE